MGKQIIQIIKMVTQCHLEKQASKFLNKEVLAVGLFDVSVNYGKRVVAPAAVGLATGLATKAIQKKVIKNKNDKNKSDDKSYSMGNRLLTGAIGLAAAAGTQKVLEVTDAKKNDLTPIMVVAVTQGHVYLLGWKGTHKNGKITEELQSFNRKKATMKFHTRDITAHTIDITEDGESAKIVCDLGPTHHNKKMNREVINELKKN